MPIAIPAASLASRLTRTLKDPAYDYDGPVVRELMLEACMRAAGRVFLPQLKTQAAVLTTVGASATAMPAVYHRGLGNTIFYGDSMRRVTRYSSLQRLRDEWGHGLNQEGDVYAVALEGATLHYVRTPIAPQPLHLQFYRKPTLEDCGLPDELVTPIVFHYVCMVLWSEIDGEPGGGSRSQEHRGEFLTLLEELQETVGPSVDDDVAESFPDFPREQRARVGF